MMAVKPMTCQLSALPVPMVLSRGSSERKRAKAQLLVFQQLMYSLNLLKQLAGISNTR
jgi:hypothetical protein